jgi:hypothetical protein
MNLDDVVGVGMIWAFGGVLETIYYLAIRDNLGISRIKKINGRRRIKKELPPYNKKYEYGQLYLDFMKDHL